MDLKWMDEALGKRRDCRIHPYQATNLGSGSGSPIGAKLENKHQLVGGLCPSPVDPESCPRALEPYISGCQPGEKGVEDQRSSPWQPSPQHSSMQHPPNYRLSSVPKAVATTALLLQQQWAHPHQHHHHHSRLILTQSTHLHDGSWTLGLSRGPG